MFDQFSQIPNADRLGFISPGIFFLSEVTKVCLWHLKSWKC